ncbi:hypothetical protein SAMN05216187_102206, partial [Jeotgalicoccus aerolatus]
MLVKDVAGLLVWFGSVRFGLVWSGPDDVVIFTTSSQAVRTTSSFSPRHP